MGTHKKACKQANIFKNDITVFILLYIDAPTGTKFMSSHFVTLGSEISLRSEIFWVPAYVAFGRAQISNLCAVESRKYKVKNASVDIAVTNSDCYDVIAVVK